MIAYRQWHLFLGLVLHELGLLLGSLLRSISIWLRRLLCRRLFKLESQSSIQLHFCLAFPLFWNYC